MIEAVLIDAPSRAGDVIFGRPLLERLLLMCQRAGAHKFIIASRTADQHALAEALGGFRNSDQVVFVDSLASAAKTANGDVALPSVRLSGNLVFAQSHLSRALQDYETRPGVPVRVVSADAEHDGMISVGPLRMLLEGAAPPGPLLATAGILPFALNGRPEDREEAEVRLASAVRDESIETDAVMARIFDRRISWRISLPLARAGVTPNQVTLANTILGLGCAAMLATTSYWIRLVGALLFLLSITIDGVDGEIARLRMVESKFGATLDVLTDNIVHVGVLVGLLVGCYRVSDSAAYFYLLPILLGGFACCAVSVNRALRVSDEKAGRWIGNVERATGRDFAYIVVLLAIVNHLEIFVWGTAIGTYVFAGVLWWLTNRERRRHGPACAA